VVRNYGLALVVITPMALSMPALGGGPVDVAALVVARGADTAIGVAVVVVALLATHRLRTRPTATPDPPATPQAPGAPGAQAA
jgi:hypothetical protein